MGKRTAYRTQKHAPHFYFIFAAVAVLIGVFGTIVYTNVFAQGTEMVYSCVQKVSGNMRIVSATESCKSNETALNWNKQGPAGPQGSPGAASSTGLPFFCGGCLLAPYADKFAGKDFSKAQINNSDFNGADLHGVIFKGGLFTNVWFNNANLVGADLSDMHPAPGLGTISGNEFKNANLTNANFSNSQIGNNDFRGANMQNVNLSNTSLGGVNFSGAQNMSTADITSTTWNNCTCPDGSNSNGNGNTCVGHF